jgi:hypothetical protein
LVPTIRYDPTSAALKLDTNAATRPRPNRRSAPVDSSTSSSFALPLLTEIAMTSSGSARNKYRAALMQYTPMS